MDRDALADFLRRRREALQPEDVGLPPTDRRRTAGLRREEVARLAHMSTDFYTRLEQRRGSRPSAETVAAIGRALRLGPQERDHLHRLAGHTPPPRGTRSDHASPALLRVLDHLDTPAHITSDLGVVLGQNARSEALLGRLTDRRGLERSIFFRWFTDPSARERWHPDEHAQHARGYVAALRAAHGREPDGESRALVDALLAASAEFAQLWERHDVAPLPQTRKRLVHPLVGDLALDCQILTADNAVELLVVFTAPPGSEDAERLRLLDVVGTQTFAG